MVNQRHISISVFFPCHNEQDNIERVVSRAVEVLTQITNDYEIIIVNDGSSDQTAQIADRLTQQNPSIKVVHHQTNLGYGGALQSGFRAATKEWVFFTDGDGQFDLGELPGLLEKTDQHDVVIGYRINRREGLMRRFNGWAWSRLVGGLFGFRIIDVDCAFKIFKRSIIENMPLSSRGALISAEILARICHGGHHIAQVGVHHYPRTAGQPTGANPKVILRAFCELFKLLRQIKNEKS